MYSDISKINCPVSESRSLNQRQLTGSCWIGFPSCFMKLVLLLAIAFAGTPIENLSMFSKTLLHLTYRFKAIPFKNPIIYFVISATPL